MLNSANKISFVSTRLGDVISEAIHALTLAGLETPSLDVHWLIGDTLGLDRTQLFTQSNHVLPPQDIAQITTVLMQRLAHVPVARILGTREFWGLPFGLNEATLEPRPDSETLIEITLKYMKDNKEPLRIVDLGTGTGCLLLSLLHALPHATGLGIDISPRASEQAEVNARHLNLETRARFITNNWLDNIEEVFDIIISNPPYIAKDVIPSLMPEVRDNDPMLALDGGDDGLVPYRHLIPKLIFSLKPGGLAVFEVGYDQANFVASLMQQNHLAGVTIHKDIGGQDRCVTGLKIEITSPDN